MNDQLIQKANSNGICPICGKSLTRGPARYALPIFKGFICQECSNLYLNAIWDGEETDNDQLVESAICIARYRAEQTTRWIDENSNENIPF